MKDGEGDKNEWFRWICTTRSLKTNRVNSCNNILVRAGIVLYEEGKQNHENMENVLNIPLILMAFLKDF